MTREVGSQFRGSTPKESVYTFSALRVTLTYPVREKDRALKIRTSSCKVGAWLKIFFRLESAWQGRSLRSAADDVVRSARETERYCVELTVDLINP